MGGKAAGRRRKNQRGQVHCAGAFGRLGQGPARADRRDEGPLRVGRGAADRRHRRQGRGGGGCDRRPDREGCRRWRWSRPRPRRWAARAAAAVPTWRRPGRQRRHRPGRGGDQGGRSRDWGDDMPTALWIAHVHVTDAEAYGKYAKGAARRSPRMAACSWPAAGAMCSWKATTAPQRGRALSQPGGGGGVLQLARVSGGAGPCEGRQRPRPDGRRGDRVGFSSFAH
jgi:hypothetical protein